jgi:hypothetical protein
MWIHIQILYSVPLIFTSIFVPVPCFFYCYCSIAQFEVGYCDTSSVALFVQYCFGNLQPFVFPYELEGGLSISVMNVIRILMGIA